MDILAISTSAVTGINRTIYAELRKRGWQIELVIPKSYPVSSSRRIEAEAVSAADPPIHVMELKGGNPRTFHFPQLKKLIEEKKPKVVFIESDPVSYMAVHAGRLCRKNGLFLFCLSCENLSFDILPSIKRRGIASLPAALVKQALFMMARPLVYLVFTINDDGTELFKQKKFLRVLKTPLGFDSSRFKIDESQRQEIRQRLSLRLPVIAYFGRIVEEKGVDVLLRALEKIKHLNWHFMLDRFNVYANPYHQYINNLIASLGIQDRVISIEADHYEIAGYMNAADLVVVPSVSTPKWKEQYGRVVPEAMACGKIVIAARSGALPELIGDAGILFEEGNVQELAFRLTEYLKEPDRFDNLSLKASQRAKDLFSIQRQADIYEAQFATLGITTSRI